MQSLSELALKGYFESMKEEITSPSAGKQDKMAALLEKAVAIIEEVYEKDFNLLHADNAQDYREMIEALNEQGVPYKGKKEILSLAGREQSARPHRADKLPMQKASGAKNRKTEQEPGRKSG